METIKILNKRHGTSIKGGNTELWLLETDKYDEVGFFANTPEEKRLIEALPINRVYEVDIKENATGKYIDEIRDCKPIEQKNTKKDIPIGLMSLIKCSVELAKTDDENSLSACIDIAEREYKRLLGEWCE